MFLNLRIKSLTMYKINEKQSLFLNLIKIHLNDNIHTSLTHLFSQFSGTKNNDGGISQSSHLYVSSLKSHCFSF